MEGFPGYINKWKKAVHKRASIAECYFLCENEGKIIYASIFPLIKKSIQGINLKLMRLLSFRGWGRNRIEKVGR